MISLGESHGDCVRSLGETRVGLRFAAVLALRCVALRPCGYAVAAFPLVDVAGGQLCWPRGVSLPVERCLLNNDQ